MYKKQKERHFLLHTIEHLFGVFAIVVLAATVGYFASAETSSLSTATTTSITNASLLLPAEEERIILSTDTTNSPVTFAVTIAPETDCSSGQPMTKVFFAVSSALGGIFDVTSSAGMSHARLEWGEYPLPNGTYAWKGITNSGFIAILPDSGEFEVNGICATLSATANDWMVGSVLRDYPETTTTSLSLLSGTSRIESGASVSETMNVIAESSSASRVGFVMISLTGGIKFFGGEQGVFHDSLSKTWNLKWNSTNVPDGDYVLFAVVETTGGILRSRKIYFHVQNNLPLQQSAVMTTVGESAIATIPQETSKVAPQITTLSEQPMLPRPILKLFFDNKPITDPRRIFNDEDIEIRLIVSLAKKVNFIALESTTATALQLGSGVIDDLLSTQGMDVWTYMWSATQVKNGSYKVFARVLRTDGTVVETVPVPILIMHESLARNATSTESTVVANEPPEILATDPSDCVGVQDCATFCASHLEAKERCEQFARMNIEALSQITPSLSDGISDDRVLGVLSDPRKRPKEMPDIIQSAVDFHTFCAQLENNEVCTKALVNNDLATSELLEQKKADIANEQQKERIVFAERVGARMFIDSDKDSITDYDEINIYHTNVSDPDSDRDGFFDGAEILAGTNPNGVMGIAVEHPRGTSSKEISIRASEEVRMENPLIGGAQMPTLLSVTNVSVAEVGLGGNGAATAKKLKLSGQALPNSFVKIYIFSDPIVVTVRTDANGAWTYILDKELPDGTHQIVSAITDAGGRILAKSVPLPFVKEAAAVSLGAQLLPSPVKTPGFFSGASLYALVAIVLAVAGLGLSVIGFMVFRKAEEHSPTHES